MTTSRRGAVGLAVATVLLLTASACSSSKSTTAATTAATSGTASTSASASAITGTITVLAAASLKATFTTIITSFEAAHPGTKVTLITGGSSDLAVTINNNGPADVFASASTKTMQSVISAGHATSSTNFAKNQMEIATQPGNPKKITKLQDLTNPSIKVAVCKAKVPCGDAATALFTKEKLTIKPVTYENDVSLTLAKVSKPLLLVDAAIVYVTDVKTAGSKVTGVEIPAADNYVTTYPITVVKQAKNPTTAKAFDDYVLSAEGEAVFAAAGFLSP